MFIPPPPPDPPVVLTFPILIDVPEVAPANMLTEPLVPVPPPPVVMVRPVGAVIVPELVPVPEKAARVTLPPLVEPLVVNDPNPLILI
jgi:hypothetical protein